MIMNINNLRQAQGFSLMEVIVTVAIAGILALAAVASFGPTIQRSRIAEDASRFVTDLKHARSEAIKRRTNVVVCASNNGTNCKDNQPRNWSDGWLVFTDSDEDNQLKTTKNACQPTPTTKLDCLLRTQSAINANNQLMANVNISHISFDSQGNVLDVAERVEFTLCTNKYVGDESEKSISVEINGHITVNNNITCP